MSSRIISGLSRLLRPRMTEGPQRPSPREAEGGRPARPGDGDGFRAPRAIPSGRPAIRGEERAPVKTVAELLPPDLGEVSGQEGLAHRFASDAALLAMQLKPAQLPGSERAQRLWAFYAAYATAAAALPPQPESREAFREALQGQGFAELRDARTGEDGVAKGLWVLTSRTPDEARERASTVQLEPPPDVRHSETVARQDFQTLRGLPAPIPFEQREKAQQAEEGPRRNSERWRRLSPRMLWNVLHTFRDGPEDGAVAEGQWDRVAFAAILGLTVIALLVIALVSL